MGGCPSLMFLMTTSRRAYWLLMMTASYAV
jgi:hypothetical protein